MVGSTIVRSRLRIGGAALVLGALLAGIVWFVSSPASGAETLRFFGRYREFVENPGDIDGDGEDEVGEYFAGQFILRQDGDKVGHINFHCVHASAPPMRNLCSASVRVSGKGTIQVQGGQNDNSESFNGAIIGGTGAYRSATGIFHLKFARHGVHVRVELD